MRLKPPCRRIEGERTPNKKQIQDPPLKCKYIYIYTYSIYIYKYKQKHIQWLTFYETTILPWLCSFHTHPRCLPCWHHHLLRLLRLPAPPRRSPPHTNIPSIPSAWQQEVGPGDGQIGRHLAVGSSSQFVEADVFLIILRKSWRVWINNLWIIYSEYRAIAPL